MLLRMFRSLTAWGQKLRQRFLLVLLIFSVFFELWANIWPLICHLCSMDGWITCCRAFLSWAVQEAVFSRLFLCPHFQLLDALVLEKPTVTISTLQIYQPCLIPLVKSRWKILTLSLQPPVAVRLQCLAHLVRLGDSSFQLSVTCKMRKKSSGSFMPLCAGFVYLWKFSVFVVDFSAFVKFWGIFVCIYDYFVCHCEGF